MWATQIETQQRLKIYNLWMPHVHVDFHEQGINSPYILHQQQSPFIRLLPIFKRNFKPKLEKIMLKHLTKKSGPTLLENASIYFTPSYGDTYPTYNGAIGMTYEQAGSGQAGLGVNTDEGYELTLKDRIRHHVQTGLSTVETSSENAEKLNSEFKTYFKNTVDFDYYVLVGEKSKLNTLTKLFDQHDYEYKFSKEEKLKGKPIYSTAKISFDAVQALVVPANQPKSKMLKVLLEADPKLSTPLTYDITSWNLALAHGVQAYTVSGNINTQPKENPYSQESVEAGTVGYIAKWKSMTDAKFLAELLQNKIKVRATTKPFKIENESYDRGSLILTKTNNRDSHFDSLVMELAYKYHIKLAATQTSFSDSGTDFGSPDIKKINSQRIAVLRGDEVSSLSYGSIWHFFEQELNYPIISIDAQDLNKIDLKDYDILILPSGSYSKIFNKKKLSSLSDWIKNGGKLIAMSSALSTF